MELEQRYTSEADKMYSGTMQSQKIDYMIEVANPVSFHVSVRESTDSVVFDSGETQLSRLGQKSLKRRRFNNELLLLRVHVSITKPQKID